MFGFSNTKKLKEQLAIEQLKNKELVAKIAELEKQNKLMRRAMEVVSNAKKGMK